MADKPTQQDIEDSFRNALDDVIAVAEKLSLRCNSISDMLEIVKLAKESDGQLRLLLSLVKETNSRR